MSNNSDLSYLIEKFNKFINYPRRANYERVQLTVSREIVRHTFKWDIYTWKNFRIWTDGYFDLKKDMTHSQFQQTKLDLIKEYNKLNK